MEINYITVLVATVLQFILGAVWYSVFFNKAWARIHTFGTLSKEEQERLMKGMPPFYALQFLLTLVTTLVLALFVAGLPAVWNIFGIAGFFWIGFIVPTQVSAVIFSDTPRKWMFQKIAIMAGASFVCSMIAAGTLHLF